MKLADGTGKVKQVNRFEMRASQLETLPPVPEVHCPSPRSSQLETDSTSSAEDALVWIDEANPQQIPFIPETPQLLPSAVPLISADEDVSGVDPNPSSDEEEAPQPRRTQRTTAGQHTNPYNLPRSTVTSASLGVVGAAALFESSVGSNCA